MPIFLQGNPFNFECAYCGSRFFNRWAVDTCEERCANRAQEAGLKEKPEEVLDVEFSE